MIDNKGVLKSIERGLIVSCQALEDEPLHDSFIMAKMAYAAKEGGAKGIRANSVEDIIEIKKLVELPVIGIIKKVYGSNPVFITPTEQEVDQLMLAGPEIIALDATNRLRPDGKTLDEFFNRIRKKYKDVLFMADCSCIEDARHAQSLGFDLAGTTLCGYTEETKHIPIPNYSLIQQMTEELTIPVIAEGGVWESEQLKKVFSYQVHAAVVGTAITRPREITKRFVAAIVEEAEACEKKELG